MADEFSLDPDDIARMHIRIHIHCRPCLRYPLTLDVKHDLDSATIFGGLFERIRFEDYRLVGLQLTT